MAIDKAVDSTILDGYFTGIANAIRAKAGTSGTMTPSQMPTEIANIPTGGGGDTELQELLIGRTKKGYDSDITIDLSNLDIDKIGAYAFYQVLPSNASGSTVYPYDVVLPRNKIKSIGDFAFNSAPVKSINLEDLFDDGQTWINIGMRAFAGANGSQTAVCRFTSLTLPERVYTGNFAFSYSLFLQSVSGPMLCPSNRTFGNSAFSACTALRTVNLYNAQYLTAFGIFSACSALEQIRLKSLVSLATYGLTDNNDPYPALKLIDYGQISTATGYIVKNKTIKLAVFRNTTLVTLSNLGALGDTDSPIRAGSGTILVPRDLIASYETATNWSTVYAAGTQFLAVEDYTVDGTTTGDLDDTKIAPLIA